MASLEKWRIMTNNVKLQ